MGKKESREGSFSLKPKRSRGLRRVWEGATGVKTARLETGAGGQEGGTRC